MPTLENKKNETRVFFFVVTHSTMGKFQKSIIQFTLLFKIMTTSKCYFATIIMQYYRLIGSFLFSDETQSPV